MSERIVQPFLRSSKIFPIEKTQMNRDKPQVMVAYGMYRYPHPRSIDCVMNLVAHANAVQDDYQVFVSTVVSTYIDFMRSTFADRLLSDPTIEAVCFIDDDMIFPVGPTFGKGMNQGLGFNPLQRLMSLEKDMVGGLYFSRTADVKPWVGWENEQGICRTDLTRVERMVREGPVEPVDFLGFGFVLIRRRVFERCLPLVCDSVEALFGQVSNWRVRPACRELAIEALDKYRSGEVDPDGAMELLDRARSKADRMGEDYSFCRLARRAGCEIWCDASWDLVHMGDYGYGRLDWIAKRQTELQAAEQQERKSLVLGR